MTEGEPFYGPHVCGPQCDTPRGCVEGKSEANRLDRILGAKKICLTCSERVECLDWALRNNEPHGVWGGLTEGERRKVKQRRGY